MGNLQPIKNDQSVLAPHCCLFWECFSSERKVSRIYYLLDSCRSQTSICFLQSPQNSQRCQRLTTPLQELIVIKRVYGKAAQLSTVSGSKVVLSVSRWRREAAHLCTNYTPAHAQSYTECVTVSAPSFTHLLFTPARNLSFWTLMSHHRQM